MSISSEWRVRIAFAYAGPMASDPQHRWTEFDFPAYTYVPGQQPHPTREEAGHSFGRDEPHVETFDVEHWHVCSTFLFGVDLFNAGFFWESHEQWEAVWNALNRVGVEADFLKGLIKLAAAKVKALEGKPNGTVRHANRAEELFAFVAAQHETLCGLNLSMLREHATELASHPEYEFSLAPSRE